MYDIYLPLNCNRELQRNIEAKDKRLDEAMNVLKTMRTARIVWPNPAFEVFLAGSFDGWTSQVTFCLFIKLLGPLDIPWFIRITNVPFSCN